MHGSGGGGGGGGSFLQVSEAGLRFLPEAGGDGIPQRAGPGGDADAAAATLLGGVDRRERGLRGVVGVHEAGGFQGEAERAVLVRRRELLALALRVCMRDHAPPLPTITIRRRESTDERESPGEIPKNEPAGFNKQVSIHPSILFLVS